MGVNMADRFIKYLPSGVVYIYDTSWASKPDFIEVADAEGNPMPDTSQNPTYTKSTAKRVTEQKVEVSDDELALQADAARGLPK